MTEQRQDGAHENGGDAAPAETFAKLLGERWQTDGDGIYRLVEDPPHPAEDFELRRQAESSADERSEPAVRRWLRRVTS